MYTILKAVNKMCNPKPFKSKFGLPRGAGTIQILWERRKKFQARKTKYNRETGRNELIYCKSFVTYDEAVLALAANFTKSAGQLHDKTLTFEQIYEIWLQRKSGAGRLSESTVKQYASAFKKCGDLHKRRFADITADDLQTVLDDAGNFQSANQVKALLHQLYIIGLNKEIVSRDKSKYVYPGENKDAKEKEIFSRDEAKRVIEKAAVMPFGGVVLTMLYSGMRVSEAVNLRIENVDFKDKVFHGFGVKTKSGKKRIVPLHSELFPITERLCREAAANGSENLFTYPQNGERLRVRNFYRYYKNILLAAGVSKKHNGVFGNPTLTQECRHTFVSKLKAAGVDKLTQQRLAGHKNLDVTESYTHIALYEMREAVEKVRY